MSRIAAEMQRHFPNRDGSVNCADEVARAAAAAGFEAADEWGRDYQCEWETSGSIRLSSLGADGKMGPIAPPGTRHADVDFRSDIVLRITAKDFGYVETPYGPPLQDPTSAPAIQHAGGGMD